MIKAVVRENTSSGLLVWCVWVTWCLYSLHFGSADIVLRFGYGSLAVLGGLLRR